MARRKPSLRQKPALPRSQIFDATVFSMIVNVRLPGLAKSVSSRPPVTALGVKVLLSQALRICDAASAILASAALARSKVFSWSDNSCLNDDTNPASATSSQKETLGAKYTSGALRGDFAT